MLTSGRDPHWMSRGFCCEGCCRKRQVLRRGIRCHRPRLGSRWVITTSLPNRTLSSGCGSSDLGTDCPPGGVQLSAVARQHLEGQAREGSPASVVVVPTEGLMH